MACPMNSALSVIAMRSAIVECFFNYITRLIAFRTFKVRPAFGVLATHCSVTFVAVTRKRPTVGSSSVCVTKFGPISFSIASQIFQ